MPLFGIGTDFFFADDGDAALEDDEAEGAEEAEGDGASGGITAGADRADVLEPVDAVADAGNLVSPDAYDVSCALRAA